MRDLYLILAVLCLLSTVSLFAQNESLPYASGTSSGNYFFGGITDNGQQGLRLFYNLNQGGFIDTRSQTATEGLTFRVDTDLGRTRVMRLNANGNVGIGTTNPIARLNVRGDNILLSSPTSSNKFAALGESGGGPGSAVCDLYGYRAQFTTTNSVSLGVKSNGRAILNWGNTLQDLEFRVGAASSSCGSLVATFDRFGLQGKSLSSSGKVVAQDGFWELPSDNYEQTGREIRDPMTNIQLLQGTITEDAASIEPNSLKTAFPAAVATDLRDNEVVNYTKLIPLLVEGMKQQQRSIEDLSAIVKRQELLIQDLRNSLQLNADTQTPTTASSEAAYTLAPRPNPARNFTNVDYKIPSDFAQASLRFFSIDGKLVHEQRLTSNFGTEEIATHNFRNGSYVVLLSVDGSVKNRKIISVQR